jgi:hypothetical protein
MVINALMKGIGRSFPCEISFPMATSSQLHSITHITVVILQMVWFLQPTRVKERPRLLAKDVYPVTQVGQLEASIEPQRVSLPLPDPIIHGRYTSDVLRVRHGLQIVFHRRWLGKKVEWVGDVEIFHRDVGWETRGMDGVLEIVRGQEGDFGPLGELGVTPAGEGTGEQIMGEQGSIVAGNKEIGNND